MARNGNIPRDESWIIDAITGKIIGFRETYGIYSHEISPIEEEEENKPGPPLYVRERDRLAGTARAELRAAGEQTDQEIIKRFEPAQMDQPIHDALVNWFEGIISRHGKLSRLSYAAKFLLTEQMMVLNNRPPSDPAGMLAAWSFAQAWHEWHMEVFGEHVSAASAGRSARGSAKGTAEVQRKRQWLDEIIEGVIGTDIDREGARLLRKRYFKEINNALPRELTDGALEKKIMRIKARRKDKSG